MARRRRRRTDGGADNAEEFEDDDDLDIRVTSVEEELQNLSLSALNQQRDTQALRAKLEKVARELEEGGEEDDEAFKEIDEIKAQIGQIRDQFQGVSGRLEAVAGMGTLEEMPGHLERRVIQKVDEQLRYLTERLEERLASMEAAREEESDLSATRIEELSSQVEGVINALRDEVEQVLVSTQQGFAQELEAVNQAVQSGVSSGQVQEQIQHLSSALEQRLETLTGELDQNLQALEGTMQASLEANQREGQEALTAMRGELAQLADVQATVADIAEALDGKAASEEMAELRQSLDDLKRAMGDTAQLGERSREALALVGKLETSIKDMDERFARIAKASEESAAKAEAHQERVNLAVKLVDRLDDTIKRVGSGGGGGAAASNETPVSEEDLDVPEKTELGFELKDLLQVMVKHQASDLHLKVGAPPTVRLEGELIPVGNQNLGAEDCRRLVFAALARPARRQLLQQKCLDFSYEMAPGTKFRGNAFMERGYLGAAFRMMRSEVQSLEELGLPPATKRLASMLSGLVIVAGPAGSNVTTPLASMVDQINTNRKVHIITIEDPIEYHFKNKQTCIITQREVGHDALTFKAGLREALRQDPDVIVLSDLPDADTLMGAVAAADSGRLVLACMSTANVVQTVDRIIDSFSGAAQRQVRMQLASCLRGVLCLRLMPRRDSKTRVYACEVLVGNPTVSQLILDNRLGELASCMANGQAEGMQTMSQHLARLYETGMIGQEDVAVHAKVEVGAPPAGPASSGAPPAPPPAGPQSGQPPTSPMSEDTLMNWL